MPAGREPGSEEWWEAVVRANVENSKHMGEEERGALTDLRLHADPNRRVELGLRWLEFRAAHERPSEVAAKDKDADEYIQENEPH